MYKYKDYSPVFDQGKVAKLEDVYDIEAIKNSLRNIFVIQKNEVPGKPWFGNPLGTELFDLFSTTTEETYLAAIENAVAQVEPRVEVKDVKITISPEYNRIIVDLFFTYNDFDETLNTNLLIPYSHNNFTYLNERTTMTIENKQ